MNEETWSAVDSYITGKLLCPDPALDAALAASNAAGLPEIAVAPNQGMMLQMFARLVNARRILEIGTLGGYSTLWLARALPRGGRLVTLEFDPHHAEVARANFSNAGLAHRIDLRVGPALESLPKLAEEKPDPFDFVFIDANKEDTAEYFAWALKLSRVGSFIIADNVVRSGAVIDPSDADPRVQGMRKFFDTVAAEPRVSATAIQTVGSKGYDGFAMALVVA